MYVINGVLYVGEMGVGELLISPNYKVLLHSVPMVVAVALQIAHNTYYYSLRYAWPAPILTTSWAVGDEGHVVVVDNDPGSAVRGHVEGGAAGADHVTVLALRKTWHMERQ